MAPLAESSDGRLRWRTCWLADLANQLEVALLELRHLLERRGQIRLRLSRLRLCKLQPLLPRVGGAVRQKGRDMIVSRAWYWRGCTLPSVSQWWSESVIECVSD